MQPDLHREGYGIFVRCCDLSSKTPAGEFVSVIDALDGILFGEIGEKKEDFFPSPYGGAMYRGRIDEALKAARALVGGLSAGGISAAIGIAWGLFQRTVNVQDWNAAALPLNQGARLAFCDKAVGRVLVTPHVRQNADARVEFSDERNCVVKGAPYPHHAIESPDFQQRLAVRIPAQGTPRTRETNLVLWDVVKYSAKSPEEQADLSQSLAQIATTALETFHATQADYSPTGDGGFALFDKGIQAIAFAKRLGRYAVSKGITIRIGIDHGEVAFASRGPVGCGVLRADKISGQAPPNGIAILADIWRNLDKISQEDWQCTETARDMFTLEAKTGAVSPAGAVAVVAALSARDINILVRALSNIPLFLTERDRHTFIRMVLSEYEFAAEAHKTLGFLNWAGPPQIVADNLVHLLEGQEAAPGLPALRVIAEAIEPIGGMAHREELAGLRRRLGWGAR